MIFGDSKKGFKDFTVKGIAALSAFTLLFATGCSLYGSDFATIDKDIDTDYHARIVYSENTDNLNNQDITTNIPDNKENQTLNTDKGNDTTDNGNVITDNGNETTDNGNTETEEKVINPGGFLYVDSCGFEVNNPSSFANRAQGLYKIVSDDSTAEYIEFYNINDNLYAFYSGKGYGAMELFTDDSDGFASEAANSMRVKILSFTALKNDGNYISNGNPAILDMTFTQEGIEFTNYDTSSGELLFAPAEVKLEKVKGDMGYIDGFAYMDDEYSAELLCEDLDIETKAVPDEIIGSWILLGDLESGIVFEFTEDGYVQAYLKNYKTEVTFLRGTYTAGKDKVNGGTNIYMNIVYIGMGQGYPFNFCYQTEGDSLVLVPGNADYGTDVAWEGAMFIPYEMNSIPRQNLD